MSLYDIARAKALAFDARLRAAVEPSPWPRAVYEFVLFGVKQAWACLFGGAMLAALLLTFWLYPADAPVARYDLLFALAVLIQAALIGLKLERPREVVVILIFHVVGTIMELFKTAQGSWTYPEASLLRIGDVPLFSGFMYACVGSYLARVSRLMPMRYTRYPPLWATGLLALGAYANFFTHHYTIDLRWPLFAASALLFGRTRVWFRPYERWRWMPLLLGFVLVALFIWLAENIGTFAAVWVYPDQRDGWRPVGAAKFGSWYLLMLLSFVLVTLVHRPRAPEAM